MHFELTEKQTELLAVTQSIMDRYCSPADEQARDQGGMFPDAMYRDMCRAGLIDIWPGTMDGSGYLDGCVVGEALGRASGTATGLYFVNGVSGLMIARGMQNRMGQDLLHRLSDGDVRFSFSLTEPGAGSDATGITTAATRQGDTYVINGTKRFATGAGEADYILAVVRTDPDQPAKTGTSILLVPTDTAGLGIRPLEKVAGNAVSTCEVVFDDVAVPAGHLIGPEHHAWGLLFAGGLLERLVIACGAVGYSGRAFDHLRDHLCARQVQGQPVTQFQSIRHQMADMATTIQAMRWLTRHAAWLADQDSPDRVAAINMAKVFAVENGNRIATDAFRLAGGRSYFVEDVLNRIWREAALGYFAGGTGEIQRNAIARSIGL